MATVVVRVEDVIRANRVRIGEVEQKLEETIEKNIREFQTRPKEESFLKVLFYGKSAPRTYEEAKTAYEAANCFYDDVAFNMKMEVRWIKDDLKFHQKMQVTALQASNMSISEMTLDDSEFRSIFKKV